MSRYPILINGPEDKRKAHRWVDAAPVGMSITFKVNKRSLDQNAKLWCLLGEVSAQVEWYGQKLSPEDWKDMFTASLRKARVSPGIDPGSFVVLGLHTSDLTKEEFSNLIELIHAFGAEHGVEFQDDKPSPSPSAGADRKEAA
jgi:hypothetical protein